MVGSAVALWIVTKYGNSTKTKGRKSMKIVFICYFSSTTHRSTTSDQVTEEDGCLYTILRKPPLVLPLSSTSIPSPFSLQTNFSCNLFTSASFCSSFSFKAASSSCNRHRITKWQLPYTSEMLSKFTSMKHSGQVLSQWKWPSTPWHLHWVKGHPSNSATEHCNRLLSPEGGKSRRLTDKSISLMHNLKRDFTSKFKKVKQKNSFLFSLALIEKLQVIRLSGKIYATNISYKMLQTFIFIFIKHFARSKPDSYRTVLTTGWGQFQK